MAVHSNHKTVIEGVTKGKTKQSARTPIEDITKGKKKPMNKKPMKRTTGRGK